MDLAKVLEALADGVNPETGDILEHESVASTPQAIRMLLRLS